MLEAIAGLSALGGGLVAPIAMRRTQPQVSEADSARETTPVEDTYEPASEELTVHEASDTYTPSPESSRREPRTASHAAESSQPTAASAKPGTAPPDEADGENPAVKAFSELTEQEQSRVTELKQTDQEVRAHEQAHQAAGGQYAGQPSYEYETGPDGRRYAVGGEVPIDTTPVAGDPQATIQKMQQVRKAALAPAQPSSTDQRVAAEASRQMNKARAELSKQQQQGSDASGNGAYSEAGTPAQLGRHIDVAA